MRHQGTMGPAVVEGLEPLQTHHWIRPWQYLTNHDILINYGICGICLHKGLTCSVPLYDLKEPRKNQSPFPMCTDGTASDTCEQALSVQQIA